MTRIIPNENSWIGFAATIPIAANMVPKLADISGCVNLTPFIISINASSTGNTVPTPSLDTLFETSISGTATATFSADMYRDNATGGDTAWTTLPRGTHGAMIISRFGGLGGPPTGKPTTADTVEVWPIIVTSRSAANMASNTAETFTVTCSVPIEPNEAAVITAT